MDSNPISMLERPQAVRRGTLRKYTSPTRTVGAGKCFSPAAGVEKLCRISQIDTTSFLTGCTQMTARRAVHADSVLWKQENEGVADNRRLCRESQAYLALVGFDGARSRVSEAAAERAWRRPPDLPLLVARNHGGARQPSMEHGYHLYPDGTRIPVPGCGDGLVQPVRAELVAVVEDGGGFLPRSAAACFAAGSAGYLQQRSGSVIHQRPVHRRTGNAPDRHQHGWAGTLHGQHFRRATVAFTQIRGGVLERLHDGDGST